MLSSKIAGNLISFTKSTLRVITFSIITHRTKESETVPISIVYLEMLLKIDIACDVSDLNPG